MTEILAPGAGRRLFTSRQQRRRRRLTLAVAAGVNLAAWVAILGMAYQAL